MKRSSILSLSAIFILAVSSALAQRVQLWDFEGGAEGWSTIGDAAQVEVAAMGPGIAHRGTHVLGIAPRHNGSDGNFQWVAAVEVGESQREYRAIVEAIEAGGMSLYFDATFPHAQSDGTDRPLQLYASIHAPEQFQFGDGEGSIEHPVDILWNQTHRVTAELPLEGLSVGPFEGTPSLRLDIAAFTAARNYTFFIDNFRIAPTGGGDWPETWFGYTVDSTLWVNTGDWLGHVWVGTRPWIWQQYLGHIFIPDESEAQPSGGWFYALRHVPHP